MSQNTSTLSQWAEIGAEWPDPVQLRHIKRLSGFPYSGGYLRNLCTGREADPDLQQHVFHIGKFPAIRKQPLIEWLEKRTRS